MTKDWTGNKKSVFTSLGASSRAIEEREKHDYYAPIVTGKQIGRAHV